MDGGTAEPKRRRNGAGGLVKLKNGLWRASVSLGKIGERRIRWEAYSKDPEEAKVNLQHMIENKNKEIERRLEEAKYRSTRPPAPVVIPLPAPLPAPRKQVVRVTPGLGWPDVEWLRKLAMTFRDTPRLETGLGRGVFVEEMMLNKIVDRLFEVAEHANLRNS